MSRLVAIIDDYRDRTGQPSDASIARTIGVARQTISSWRRRGIRELPDKDSLVALAHLAGVDYASVVLRAALLDAGWITEDESPEAEPGQTRDEAS